MILQWILDHKKILILGYFIKIALFFPFNAEAVILQATSTHSSVGIPYSSNGPSGQAFTGIVGPIENVSFFASKEDDAGTVSDKPINIRSIECFTDSSLTSACAGTGISSGFVQWEYNSFTFTESSNSTPPNYNNQISQDGATTTGGFGEKQYLTINFNATTNHTFIPSNYYRFNFQEWRTGADAFQLWGSNNDDYPGTSFYTSSTTSLLIEDMYFEYNSGVDCESDPSTRILDFSPDDGSTQSNPVLFTLSACVDTEDLGTIQGVNITLHNIDQNVLLLSDFSPNDMYLLDERDIETPGLFQYSSTTILAEGNYRIEACIERSYLFGFIINPLSPIAQCESHQFVVGTSTWIGNISQNLWGDVNDFYDGLTATSSEALAQTCNILGGSFGVRECLAFLFIPSNSDLVEVMENARSGFLTRVPWGYFTRFISILTDTATTTLPTFTSTIQMGPGNDLTPETTTITIDPGDMLAGASALLTDTRDPITNKNARDVFEPFVQLAIAIGVIFTIVTDMVKSHNYANQSESRNGKLS
jgi:hypothetical protein